MPTEQYAHMFDLGGNPKYLTSEVMTPTALAKKAKAGGKQRTNDY